MMAVQATSTPQVLVIDPSATVDTATITAGAGMVALNPAITHAPAVETTSPTVNVVMSAPLAAAPTVPTPAVGPTATGLELIPVVTPTVVATDAILHAPLISVPEIDPTSTLAMPSVVTAPITIAAAAKAPVKPLGFSFSSCFGSMRTKCATAEVEVEQDVTKYAPEVGAGILESMSVVDGLIQISVDMGWITQEQYAVYKAAASGINLVAADMQLMANIVSIKQITSILAAKVTAASTADLITANNQIMVNAYLTILNSVATSLDADKTFVGLVAGRSLPAITSTQAVLMQNASNMVNILEQVNTILTTQAIIKPAQAVNLVDGLDLVKQILIALNLLQAVPTVPALALVPSL